ncbi:probable pseudouridine-5'-phosphatase isoform X2 [Nymphalis io]|nr:probable pseudouridine-5'-phosphatase isoform X2 [Nymphalis io]XP_050354545.1 probable pseudouridine-5'-phosphatase isoform X2 [Nymphalis io]XP_050354546.1 probable pseudouridine-5'-phosphatase isoform X2 [Nymphalis io]
MIVFQQVASRYGKEFTFELKSKIMGKQSQELASSIINELNLPLSVDEFLLETRKIFDKLVLQSKVMPGVEKLLRHLHKHKVPMGLATSSSKETYDLKVTHHHELFQLFPNKTWGSSDPNVKKGKPYPDIFLIAAAKFPDAPSPDKCLVFEDSLNGVKAAVAAGMQVVMIPDPRFDRNQAPEATLILNSMEDFRPEVFGLPPFDD